MDYPVYKLRIKEDTDTESGVEFTALVDLPAIEKNFIAFSSQKEVKLNFDTEKRIISGPLMLADTPIYRDNPEYGKHYIVFDSETIRKFQLFSSAYL
jgi:hypothetical protein